MRGELKTEVEVLWLDEARKDEIPGDAPPGAAKSG
jgi:hypothetical protein